MRAPGRPLGVLALAMAALVAACATSQAVKGLDGESRDFLSKVRYIITKQERERFLAIPAGDRKAFVEEFWKKRDPNPETEVNEFKEQYFVRIAEANHLFTEAAEPGWLQDRGRVYILLGPPTDRITYPRGITFYGLPTEIWYYGFFPIVFTDAWWNGDYQLDPVSVEQLSILNRAQIEWQPRIAAEKGQIDFRVKVKKNKAGLALVEVAIPFRAVWFDVEDKTLRVTFILTLDLIEMDGKEIRQSRTEYPLEITEDTLRKSYAKDYIIDVPVEARAGDFWLRLTLENANDGSKAYKRIRLSI
ncbi:MAG TPA: GWxTD domain-containing protein [Terriglobales bacterium]|nr:GWxTD domain-containing protein [Terriglobales bacterium]